MQNDPALALLPVDLLRVPDGLPPFKIGTSGVAIDQGAGPADGLYPMFFAATRYGLKGRDLAR
jgi:hypothetical protein